MHYLNLYLLFDFPKHRKNFSKKIMQHMFFNKISRYIKIHLLWSPSALGPLLFYIKFYNSKKKIISPYHVTYTFQIESTFHSCLNVKELLAWSRRNIWSLSDCNRIRTHSHLGCKRTHNYFARLLKWFIVRL